MKLTTKFCSLKCGQRNYKEKLKREKLLTGQQEFKAAKTVERPTRVNINQKPYLTIKESCKLLNASDTTIRKAIKDGLLQTIRIGKKHIIRRQDIENLFQTN
jgi:excisionase family DNA binding protein